MITFLGLGVIRIISIQLVSKARTRGIYFTVKDLFDNPTIALLVGLFAITSVTPSEERRMLLMPMQGCVSEEVPLTPIQHWFFNAQFFNMHHFNQSTLLLSRKKLIPSLLNQTFSFLITHHDVLRSRYTHDAPCWSQYCLEKDENSFCTEIDLASVSDEKLSFHIERESMLVQQNLNIETGPVIKIVLFDCGPSRAQRLLIIIHHLMVDGVSWRILIEDLEMLYTQLSNGDSPYLPLKTHSYQQWAQALLDYASSTTLQEEYLYWQEVENKIKPLPIDFNHGPASGVAARTLFSSLSKEETTDLLQKVPKAYRTQINDVLLTALLLAVGDWTKTYTLSLSLRDMDERTLCQILISHVQ